MGKGGCVHWKGRKNKSCDSYCSCASYIKPLIDYLKWVPGFTGKDTDWLILGRETAVIALSVEDGFLKTKPSY